MSEDPNVMPDQPAELPISDAQPEQEISPTSTYSEQYPPLPSMYTQAEAPDPYGAPAINYGTVYPAQPPFMPPAGYAQPPFGAHLGYDFVPSAQPLLLAQALRELPHQYRKILTKPGAHSFAEEQGKAAWDIIWMQLLFTAILAIVSVLITFIVDIHIFAALFTAMANLSVNSGNPATLTPATFTSPSTITILAIEAVIAGLFTPFWFLLGVVIQFGMAKLFRGHGQYKQQVYNHLLFYIPMQIITLAFSMLLLLFTALSVNPITLILILIVFLTSIGLGIYSVVLN
ncbi:MAG: hypothetical protein ACRDHZ_17870, partial [Ktedonobacteraceae bacterium]